MQPVQDPPVSEDAAAEALVPPRYWWLKRLGGPIFAVSACLIVLHVSMMIVTQRRIDALVKAYRDAGQPVLPEDFNPKAELPPERNAATLYKKAIDAYVLPASFPATLKVATLTTPDALREHHAIAAELVSTNGAALEYCRRARSLTEIDWEDPISSPMMRFWPQSLYDQRQLIQLLGVACLYHHIQGNDAESVEVVRDALHLASLTDAQSGELTRHLYAGYFVNHIVACIEVIAPGMRISGAITWRKDDQPASPSQVEALIEDLADTDPLFERWRMVIWGGRASVLDAMTLCDARPGGQRVILGGLPFSNLWDRAYTYVHWRLVRPVWRRDTPALLQYHDRALEAYDSSSYPATIARLPGWPQMSETVLGELNPAAMVYTPITSAAERRFHSIAMRRMAALALALRLYEIDHSSRPSGLEQLVPQYLREIPLDPFATDERSIGHLLNSDKPLLYSVNLDGMDDGGEYELDKYGDVKRRSKDLVFFLDGNRPSSAPPATQPVSAKGGHQQVEADSDDGQDTEDQDDAPEPGQRK